MAAPNPVRIIPATSGNLRAGGEYVIRDEFTTDRAAGAVNGTAAEPGPGTRFVVDTEGKITIAGGALMFAGGKASPAWGDPGLRFNSTPRVAGRVLIAQRTYASGYRVFFGAHSTSTIQYPDNAAIGLDGGSVWVNISGEIQVGAAIAGTAYSLCVVLRGAGCFYLIKGGTFIYWTLLFVQQSVSGSPLYVSLGAHYSSFDTVNYVRVPLARWLPTPLVSHGFGSAYGTSDGLGHAEGVAGGIGAGGAGVVFSNAGNTWSVAAGKAINTPTLGATELIANGNMETGDPPTGWTENGSATLDGVADERTGGAGAQSLSVIRGTNDHVAYQGLTIAAGTWVRLSAWVKNISATSSYSMINTAGIAPAIAPIVSGSWTNGYATGRADTANPNLRNYAVGATGNEIRVDDVSVKALTLSQILSVANLACADVLAGVALTRSSVVVQAGLALNWDSPTSPANGVIVYLHSSNLYVDKCVAGTWSNVSTTAYTYSAGARLVVQKSGTSYRTYYNNVLVKADTIADAGILSNTYGGLFSTDSSNTFDDLCIYATGTSGEYAALDAF